MEWRKFKLFRGSTSVQVISFSLALSLMFLIAVQLSGMRQGLALSMPGILVRGFAGIFLLLQVFFQGERNIYGRISLVFRDYLVSVLAIVTIFYSFYASYMIIFNGVYLDVPGRFQAFYDFLIFVALSFEIFSR